MGVTPGPGMIDWTVLAEHYNEAIGFLNSWDVVVIYNAKKKYVNLL